MALSLGALVRFHLSLDHTPIWIRHSFQLRIGSLGQCVARETTRSKPEGPNEPQLCSDAMLWSRCLERAGRGECNTNRDFMHENCKASCNVC
mmetsp:Transcript_8326/g.25014  ORF Transcript_8326/g.25014 Transcript_8326/m.25014 type:complete len:92 (+) Transcript_8326:279-554(+)